MTDRNPFLNDVVSALPADPDCERCHGKGCFYDIDWMRTCFCRYPSRSEVESPTEPQP